MTRACPSIDGRPLPTAKGTVLATLLVTLALLLPLFEAWWSARTNGTYTGGIVPVQDASDYYAGAQRLLADGTLDGWNSRRPLNAVLFAVRLALSGNDFRAALVLQALLTATCMVLAARAVAADFGRAAGALVCMGLYAFASIYVATTMSESLGLSLGALSLALLWHAARRPRAWNVALGFAVCTLALNARAGAFLTLPCLLVAIALGDGRFDVRRFAWGALGVMAGFGTNALVGRVHRAVGGGHANFSYTVYGLAHRGIGWERALADLPELHGMSDARAGAYVYARSFEHLRAHPWDLIVGLFRNVECFVLSTSEKLSAGILDGHSLSQWAYAVVWVGGVVLLVRRVRRLHGGDPCLQLAGFAGIGMLGSIPVIYMDGRERVFAASFPFMFAGAAVALLSLRRGAARVGPAGEEVHARLERAPALLAGVLVALALVGPRLAATHPDVAVAPCPAGEETLVVRMHRGIAHVRVTERGPSFAPDVQVDDLRSGIARDVNLGQTPYETVVRALRAGDALVAAYDLRGRRLRLVVGPAGVVDRAPRTLQLCGVNDLGADARLFHVRSYDVRRELP